LLFDTQPGLLMISWIIPVTPIVYVPVPAGVKLALAVVFAIPDGSEPFDHGLALFTSSP